MKDQPTCSTSGLSAILPLWPLFMNENGGFYFMITPSLFDVITLYVAMVC